MLRQDRNGGRFNSFGLSVPENEWFFRPWILCLNSADARLVPPGLQGRIRSVLSEGIGYGWTGPIDRRSPVVF